MEPVRIFQQDGETHLLFNSLLSVAQARALHAQLGQVLASPFMVVMDAGQVEQVDTAAMQVLAGFCRHLREQGAPMRWQAISPAVQQAGHLLGLDGFFGEPA
jgi:anti-anti-sigma regulatory factor